MARTLTLTVCRHDLEGFCWDDATPEEREAFGFLYRHAFDFAAASGDVDEAERYAAFYADRNWRAGVEGASSHRVESEAFRAVRA